MESKQTWINKHQQIRNSWSKVEPSWMHHGLASTSDLDLSCKGASLSLYTLISHLRNLRGLSPGVGETARSSLRTKRPNLRENKWETMIYSKNIENICDSNTWIIDLPFVHQEVQIDPVKSELFEGYLWPQTPLVYENISTHQDVKNAPIES